MMIAQSIFIVFLYLLKIIKNIFDFLFFSFIFININGKYFFLIYVYKNKKTLYFFDYIFDLFIIIFDN